MTARPLTPAEIALHEMGWQAGGLYALVVATVETCGVARPACVSLLRMMALELATLSVAHGAAEQRIAGRKS